ncbi:carbon-nitrogen hydrolase family protein [Bradyrhizobium sp. NP1]|uniref:carbon-nitrogen hydrolase family protein n=1 Tax=Bradyrhizobium sp. NP1 TaxID=3049772 RepID=UPI0025A5FC53|nr:carbon-nitrogen hydrolase family protein [Bradyrhizobium sp. NP1]WJR80935.1 carbon-nitrogen hydrolase family protein [Bradyrhizobium sp. NP1]
MAGLTVACVQLNPGDDLAANVATASEFIRQAAVGGAQFVALPEFCTFLHRSGTAMRAAAKPEDEHPGLQGLLVAARDSGVWLLAGSIVVKSEDDAGRLANRSYLISPEGACVATYDKLHMFDAILPDGRETLESRSYRAGRHAVVVRLPSATLGLSICYDLRFPSLYRALARSGADILMVPSAFAAATGKAHWHTLLRARAIENGCFVVAPATCGMHPGGWQTFGHSMIVDPWGEILAESGQSPGLATATIDLSAVASTRSQLPTLRSDVSFDVEEFDSTNPVKRPSDELSHH